jgi:hypothetical protein
VQNWATFAPEFFAQENPDTSLGNSRLFRTKFCAPARKKVFRQALPLRQCFANRHSLTPEQPVRPIGFSIRGNFAGLSLPIAPVSDEFSGNAASIATSQPLFRLRRHALIAQRPGFNLFD